MTNKQYLYLLSRLDNITLSQEQLDYIASLIEVDIDTIVESPTNKIFTSTERTKLTNIAAGAEVNVNADWNSDAGDSQILNKPTISGSNTGDNATNTLYSGLAASKQDAMGADDNYVTDTEKTNLHAPGSDNQDLSGKQDTLVSGTNIKTINGVAVLGSGDMTVGGGAFNTLRTTSDQTINAGAGVFTDITGLTFPVVNGVDYAFHFYITFRSAATTTGWRAGVNCPTGVLDFWAQSDIIANGTAGVATHTERHNVTRDDMTLLTATITQNVDLAIRIEGRYKCTQNGTFAARFANELAANTQIVVQKGSWGYYF